MTRAIVAGRRSVPADQTTVAMSNSLLLAANAAIAYGAGRERLGHAYVRASVEVARGLTGAVVLRRKDPTHG